MRDGPKIVTNSVVRDERIERQIMEYNRKRIIYVMIGVGAALVLFAAM